MHIERRRRSDRNNKVNYYRVENGSARLAPTFGDGTDDDDGGLCCSHTLWLFMLLLFFFHFYYFVMKRQGRPSKCVRGRICMTRFVRAEGVWRGEGSSATTVAADAYERQCTIFVFFFPCLIKPNTFRANAHTRDERRGWNGVVAVCAWRVGERISETFGDKNAVLFCRPSMLLCARELEWM